MILTPTIAETAAILAKTPDDILPLFPPLERAVIMVAKEMMRNEKNALPEQVGQRGERLLQEGTLHAIRQQTS